MPGLNDRPENIREVVEAVNPTSILPQSYAQAGGRDVMAALFTSRERVNFVGDRVPPWWTEERDRWLYRLVLGSDVLASSIFSTSARLRSIPVNIVARDPGNRNDRRVAGWSHMLLQYYWSQVAFQMAVEWQTQDNGCFVEVMGGGAPGGPIEPTKIDGTNDYVYATGLRILDSQRCTRTRDPEYPVLYLHVDAKGVEKYYKFHRTRIIYTAQMPSTRRDMLQIGYCGASRCVHSVLRLDDINILEDEMLGARPISQIIFSRGISAENMQEAFLRSDQKLALDASESGKRTARSVFLSAEGSPEMLRASSVEMFDLKKLPEGYNPEVYMNLAVNVISMGLGFDPREIWPATVRGATRADAEVQHWKSMMKTPGVWVDTFTQQLGAKFAPALAEVEFDQQDDEQDAARADIRRTRAETLQVRLDSGQIDRMTAWQLMREDGDITDSQYETLVASEEMRLKAELEREELLSAQQNRQQSQESHEREMAAPQGGGNGNAGA